MQSIRLVFAATDLSEASIHAVDRGFHIARHTGAHYTVMHALGLDALGPLRNLIGHSADEVSHRVMEQQRAALETLVNASGHGHGITTRIVVEQGLATMVVPAYASATDADLLLVGYGGHGTLRRMLIGSTASRLLRKSRCPVLVVKNPVTVPYRRVLIPVDFSTGSESAIRLVRLVAPQAHIVLLHVFEVPFEGMLRYADVSEDAIHLYRMEWKEKSRQKLQALARKSGLQGPEDLDYVGVVEHGLVVQKILEYAQSHHCDLIAMGKHGTFVTENLLLGSVTKRVLSDASADMLVVTTLDGEPADECGTAAAPGG